MYDQKPTTTFRPEVAVFKDKRLNESNYTALSGSNNSGKTYLLKALRRSFDASALYIPCQRFVNQREFNTRTKKVNYYQERDRNTRNRLQNEKQNVDTGDVNLNDILFNLKNKNRGKLMELASELLQEKFSLEQSEVDNDWSSRYVQVGGFNLSYTSTGTRLLLAILGLLLDESYEVVLIDEPEIGLAPHIQNQLSQAFTDDKYRKKHFPHIKHIFVATHSHIFLDHKIENNFTVTKTPESPILINQVKTISEFHKVQFNLLGNTFESMFLPSTIVIVEGKTDRKFIKAVVNLKFPKRKVTFQEMFGDDVKRMVKIVDNFFGGLQESPYRSRVFVVLDNKSSVKKIDVVKLGLVEDNVIQWNSNGIEFYYPKKEASEIFSCKENEISRAVDIMLQKRRDVISINGIEKTKNELCDEVIERLTKETSYPQEFNEEFLDKLTKTFGL